jgi:hypothetical protein
MRHGNTPRLDQMLHIYVWLQMCLDDTSLAALGRWARLFTYASKRLCTLSIPVSGRGYIHMPLVDGSVVSRVTALHDRLDRIDIPTLSLFSPPRMPHPVHLTFVERKLSPSK